MPSQYLVDVFDEFGLPGSSIYNIVDLDRFTFRDRVPLRPVFFANRNLEPMYNVACVIRAFARIKKRHPAATLTLAGDGSQRRELQELVERLALVDVHFVGRVAPDKMHALYSAADIYLNASSIDNMPLSVLEAFAAGLPVVTTRAGGIPYIVRDEENGLLVDLDDDEAMADAGLRLLSDPVLARRLVTQGREDCQRRYNWSAVREEWVALYRELADDGRSSSPASPSDQRVQPASTPQPIR